MKVNSVLRTLRFIFFTVILFVLTLGGVVVTVLNVYTPTYRAKINGETIGFFTTEEEFAEIYKTISDEKNTDGLEVKTYLEQDPLFELSYVRKEKLDKQNLYTAVREKVKSEYTVYNVLIKDNKEMVFASKDTADKYVETLTKEVKELKAQVIPEKVSSVVDTTTNEKAEEISKELVSRYKPKPVIPKVSYKPRYKPSSAISYNTTAAGGVKPTSGLITQYYSGYHSGIDIASPIGTPIYAYKAGTVSYAKYGQTGYGNLIKVDHGDGTETYYAHLSSFSVTEGQSVVAGQHIAGMGSTGRSTGSHLHFEIRINGRTINPLAYI